MQQILPAALSQCNIAGHGGGLVFQIARPAFQSICTIVFSRYRSVLHQGVLLRGNAGHCLHTRLRLADGLLLLGVVNVPGQRRHGKARCYACNHQHDNQLHQRKAAAAAQGSFQTSHTGFLLLLGGVKNALVPLGVGTDVVVFQT